MKVSRKHFAKGRRQVTDDEVQWREQRVQLLAQRGRLRRQRMTALARRERVMESGSVVRGRRGRDLDAAAGCADVDGEDVGALDAAEARQGVAAEFMLWKVGRQLDRARRLRWRKELHESWTWHDLAACHRLSLLIAGKSKRVKWRSVSGQIPEKQQWTDFLAKDGCDGGMKAQEVDFEEEISRLHTELDDGLGLQAKHVDQAREDWELVGRYMVGATKRKCPPAGSPPLEVFLMCLRPFQKTGHREPRRGLGLPRGSIAVGEAVQGAFEGLVRHVRRCDRAPAGAHKSTGFALSKTSGKVGVAGLQLLQNGDPLWKSTYGCWLRKGVRRKKPWRPTLCHGFLPGRRRGEAMCSQYIMADRLRRARIGYLTTFHDLTNAFASPGQEELAHSALSRG